MKCAVSSRAGVDATGTPDRARLWARVLCPLLVAASVWGCAGPHRAPVMQPGSEPTVGAEEPELPEGVFHVVEPGQTLWRIARVYGVPLETLIEANDVRDPTGIEVGRVLFVPTATRILDVAPYPAPLPPREPQGAPEPGRAGGHDFVWPVANATVLSYFGERRRDHRHQGLDLRGGPKVMAAAAGSVIYSGNSMRGYGHTVILEHGRGLRSLYAHNRRLLVASGQRVERGQPIAIVGRTGNATAEHCHFEIRRDRVPVDPLVYLSDPVQER